MLTARNCEADKVLGLRLGADDYLTKPFSIRELAARVEAILRRVKTAEPDTPVYDDGRLTINRATFRVTFEGRDVNLTRKEFGLLEELAKNAGRVMTREILLERLWGMNHFGDSRTLDVHIRRLRQKLGNSEVIETVTGIGYRLRAAGENEQ
jgi:DNA-binding response OmpR family regulator